jgi:flavin reductase (DIM6/NTAB) family NADH-FMN oxidoreductase RutF
MTNIINEKFEKVDPALLPDNVFELIGKEWMLITAGQPEKFNTMTASWGGLGVLWNKNVVFCFVRPNRYTREFLDKEDNFTLSFLPDEFRDELMFCGTNSGREINKIEKTGLSPIPTTSNSLAFEEARLILECKKIYIQDIDPKNFLSKDIENNYPQKDYHRMFIGEITNCLMKI